MKPAAVAAVIAGGLIATPSGVAAHHHKHQRPEGRDGPMTFSGSCAFSGTVRFEPPLTTAPQPVRDDASATGSCSGTLTDRSGHTDQLDAAAVRYLATDIGNAGSCALSTSATGTGELAFPGSTLRFTLSETRVGAVAALSLTGARGGSAIGTANVNTDANPIQMIQACAGPGLPETAVDIHIQTTPAISG